MNPRPNASNGGSASETAAQAMLDHLLILSARHLEAVLKEFLVHYHQARPHQGLDQRCPDPGPAVIPLPVVSKIVRMIGSEVYSTSTPRAA